MFDLAVVGGGIIGLATGMAWLNLRPGARLLILEKEPRLAAHQTGHNSGVIHSGIYYRPGSLKAQTCAAGARLLIEFCQHHRIPHDVCGKVVVAVEDAEVPRLEQLHHRGLANGIPGLSLIGPEALREREPHARGVRALHVPEAGIVDYAAVAQAFADVIRERGGKILTSARVTRLVRRDGSWALETTAGDVRARTLITCGGLHADRLAATAGHGSDVRLVPFRGDYWELVPARRHLVRGMIYPVPDPDLPFLGVHLTRGVDGSVHVGPNAVLALKREGYRKADVSLRDTCAMLSHRGFWRMARRYWRVGLAELYRAWSKPALVRSVQRLVPEVRSEDLRPAGSGVRAQALDDEGKLLDDFDIVRADGALHVRNVPSPAATASIRIGQILAGMAIDLT